MLWALHGAVGAGGGLSSARLSRRCPNNTSSLFAAFAAFSPAWFLAQCPMQDPPVRALGLLQDPQVCAFPDQNSWVVVLGSGGLPRKSLGSYFRNWKRVSLGSSNWVLKNPVLLYRARVPFSAHVLCRVSWPRNGKIAHCWPGEGTVR